MPETEGLGKTGWAALALLISCIALVVVFGFSAAIYIGLVGTAAALVIMVLLCFDVPDAPGQPRPDAEELEAMRQD